MHRYLFKFGGEHLQFILNVTFLFTALWFHCLKWNNGDRCFLFGKKKIVCKGNCSIMLTKEAHCWMSVVHVWHTQYGFWSIYRVAEIVLHQIWMKRIELQSLDTILQGRGLSGDDAWFTVFRSTVFVNAFWIHSMDGRRKGSLSLYTSILPQHNYLVHKDMIFLISSALLPLSSTYLSPGKNLNKQM